MLRDRVLAVALILSLWACSPTLVPTPPPSATPAPTATPVSSLDPDLEAAIAKAIAFRTEVGLRTDEAHIRSVFADPTSTLDPFGTPLLKSELDELRARPSEMAEVEAIVRQYGETRPDSFGGVYVGLSMAGDTVVALFVGDPAGPRADLSKRIWPRALVVTKVAHSIKALESLRASVEHDHAWFGTVGATFRSAEVDVMTNAVDLVISGEPPGGVAEIHAHFGVDATTLSVTANADERAYRPRGSLSGQLVDAKGDPWAPGENLIVSIIGDVGAYEPDDPMGIGTTFEGSFEAAKLAEMGWTIKVYRHQTGQVVGTAHVQVVGGQTTYVEIEVGP